MRDIEGYERLYAVSIYGDVWSYRSNKFLATGHTKTGYLFVKLSKNGKTKNKYVHRLVANAYIPNPDNLGQVNHKDEDKTNNNVDNLEWCDNKYNINYGTGVERRAKTRGFKIRCTETGEEFDSINQCYYKYGWRATSIGEHLRGLRPDYKGLHFVKI